MSRLRPLLITASLDPGLTPYVAFSGINERIIAYLEGLLACLADKDVHHVVFAKNCGLRIRPEVLEEAATRRGKQLEFVQATTSPRTLRQGKGYGEGDLISQALFQSIFLREAESFVKITGKLYCPEIGEQFTGEGEGEFFMSTPHPGNVHAIRRLVAPFYRYEGGAASLAFLKRIRMPWGLIAATPLGLVDTRFYRVNRKFYEAVLRRTHARVQDSVGYNLEMAFHDDLLDWSAKIRLIDGSPEIIGTSGSLGTTAGAYPADIMEEARELASALVS